MPLPAADDGIGRFPRDVRHAGIETVRALGLDDRAILGAILTVAYFSFANRLVMATGLELEPDFARTCRPTMDE